MNGAAPFPAAWRPEQAAAAAIGLIFLVILAGLLLAGVPDAQERSLAPLDRIARPYRVPMTAQADGLIVRQIEFEVSDAAWLARQDELRLVLGTYEGRPALEHAAVRLEGTDCTFEAAAGSLATSRRHVFARRAPCAAPDGAARATLTAELRGSAPRDAQLALWAVEGAGDPPVPPLLRFSGDGATFVPAGSGLRLRSGQTVPRIVLLAFLWDRPAWHIWLLACLAGAMVLAGCTAALAARPSTLGAALSAGLVAGGLAVAYAVLVPPFHAPDEPDHLLSFTQFTARPDLETSAADLARRIHFDRMAFRRSERFRPADMERPADVAWNPGRIFAHDIETRATFTALYWRALAPVVPARAPSAVLAIRLANAAVLAIAVAAAAALVTTGVGAGGGALAVLPILLVPTLPFFGMHVSELTWAIAAFVLLGSALVRLAAHGGDAAPGAAIGLAAAIFATGPRSTWPMAVIIGGVLAGRILVRPAVAAGGSLRFWLAVAVPAALLFGTGLLRVPGQFYELWRFESVRPPGGASRTAVAAAAGGVFLLGLLLERLAAPRVPGWWQQPRLASALRVAAAAAALTVVGVALASLFVQMPHLPRLAQQRTSVTGFVAGVVATVVSAGRLRDPDFLTWTSFVGGFGWIETLLPIWIIVSLTAVWIGAAVWLLLGAARRRDPALAAWLAIIAGGFVAAIAVYAVSTYGMGRDVHGRYLLGAYTVGLMVIGSAPALLAAPGRRAAWTLAVLAALVLVHGLSLAVLLHRYFG